MHLYEFEFKVPMSDLKNSEYSIICSYFRPMEILISRVFSIIPMH